jgi:dTDP-4-dehydrorhamnose reductase
MKVAVIGKNGQLAWELSRSQPAGWQVAIWGSADLNVADTQAVTAKLQEFQPQVIINCAAYTAVDKAESDAINAYAINEKGARNLALSCQALNARLLHVSTDFVFDGRKSAPYDSNDVPNPLGVYGASKLAGEQVLRHILPDSSVVVRTSWVYSSHGNNFVKTILRLLREKPLLNVVTDQVGSPTWAKNLASWLWTVADRPAVNGLYHWSDAGRKDCWRRPPRYIPFPVKPIPPLRAVLIIRSWTSARRKRHPACVPGIGVNLYRKCWTSSNDKQTLSGNGCGGIYWLSCGAAAVCGRPHSGGARQYQ